jgi:hypothetical protein
LKMAGSHCFADAFRASCLLARQSSQIVPQEKVPAIEDVRAPRIGPSPCRKRRLRGGYRRVRLRGVRLRVFADDIGDVGRIAIDRDGRTCRPFAGDVVPEVVWHRNSLRARGKPQL